MEWIKDVIIYKPFEDDGKICRKRLEGQQILRIWILQHSTTEQQNNISLVIDKWIYLIFHK